MIDDFNLGWNDGFKDFQTGMHQRFSGQFPSEYGQGYFAGYTMAMNYYI